MVVNELVTKFSFQGSSKPLTNYNEALGTSIKVMAGLATATLAGAGAFAGFVTNIAASFDPLTQLSRTTGVAVEDIQKLGFVASQNGSNIEAVTSSIEGLSATIGEAAQFGSEEFSRLGISVKKANGEVKDADEVLMEIGQRFREMGLSRAEQISFAEKLGIDKSLIQTLNLSSEAMNRLKKQAEDLGVVTEEETNSMADMLDSITVLRFGFDSIKNSIAVGFSPVLQELAKSVTEFLGDNKKLISEGLQKVGMWITTLAQAIVRLMPVITGIGLAFLGAKIYAVGFMVTLKAIFSPVNIIIGIITGLLFIVDDLMVAFKGGESIIANFFDGIIGKSGATQKFLFDVVDAFYVVKDVIKEAGLIVFDIFGSMANVLNSILNPIIKAYNAITGSDVELFKNIEKQSKLFNLGNEQAQQIPNFGEPQAPQGIVSNNNINQDVKIEIRTDDPQTAGRSVQNSLNEQQRDAQYQLRRGGM